MTFLNFDLEVILKTVLLMNYEILLIFVLYFKLPESKY